MTLRVSAAWWDRVFSGKVYQLEWPLIPGCQHARHLRGHVFMQAERRHCKVQTRTPRTDDSIMYVQAWYQGVPKEDLVTASQRAEPMPLPFAQDDTNAPATVERMLRLRELLQCTCLPQHAPDCGSQLQPQADDWDDFLGPCTCGQAPTCTPSCSRAG